MLFSALQTTLAFAPQPEDLDDIHFDAPVIAFSPPVRDDEESEQGEP
jgi:hypothetical protein